MSIYAIVLNGTCVGTTDVASEADAQTVAQEWPGSTVVGPITQFGPAPYMTGWTYDGTNWTPDPRTAAGWNVLKLQQEIPGFISQAQSDLTTLQGWQAGQPPTAAQLQVLVNCQNGWINLLGGLQQLLDAIALGYS